MRRRLLAVPAVRDLGSFAGLAAHLGHYLSHVQVERVVVMVDDHLLPRAAEWLEDPVLPDGIDSSVRNRVMTLRESLVLKPWPCDLEMLQLNSDILLDWNCQRSSLEPWSSVKSGYRRNRTLFEVDWQHTRMGAAWFAEAAKFLSQGRLFRDDAASGLSDLLAQHGDAKRAYLVATGPSARAALDRDLSDGVRIVCNTVILDRELTDHIQPDILTFADPIFHFGPSTYAQQFQRAVVQAAERHPFWIVTTERYAPLLASHVPSLQGRIIGLRQGLQSWPDNFDLRQHPAVRPYPNVLTMLMLPIAATLAPWIGLMGFDGRDPNDERFWKHGSSVQFGIEMEEIRKVHPGFFDVDYEDYYNTHIQQLRGMLDRLEMHGTQVQSLASSHMEPLRRRQIADDATTAPISQQHEPTLVSVTPDWVGAFGHFGPFERRLRESAQSMGFAHASLAGVGFEVSDPWVLPTFTHPTHITLGQSAPYPPVGGPQFEEELRTGLSRLDLTQGSAVGFYVADVWHVPSVLSVARDHPGIRFVVNLMRGHDWIERSLVRPDRWTEVLVQLLRAGMEAAEGTNVAVAVDTEALAHDIGVLTGHEPELWPMIAVSDRDAIARLPRERQDVVHLVAPVHAQQAKGFPDLVNLAEACADRISRGELALTARFVTPSGGSTSQLTPLAERFERAGGQLVRENLSDEQFAKLVAAADVVVIPYRVNPFRTRTSGVVLDALLAAKPVIGVRGTWPGRLVEDYGVGVTYSEARVSQLVRAVDQISRNLDAYQARALEARDAVAAEYAPRRLVEFLTSYGEPGSTSAIPQEEDVHRVRQMADQLRSLYWWRWRSEQALRLDAAVRSDGQGRQADRQADIVESLKRADRRRKLAESRRPEPAPGSLESVDDQIYGREAHAHVDEIELLASVLDRHGERPGLMVDVGAHRGSAFSRFLSRGWKIIAFEPDERQFEFLQDKFGSDERVEVHTDAVSVATGEEQTFYVSDVSTGISGLSAFDISHRPVGTVRTVALKDVLPDRPVDFLKVDTEGYDLFVLQGFPWDDQQPDTIICEFEDNKTVPLGYSFADLADFLHGKGYQVWVSEWHPIVQYGVRHDWHRLTPYPCRVAPDAWGNLLAFRSPRSEKQLARALASVVEADEGPDSSASMRSGTSEPVDGEEVQGMSEQTFIPEQRRTARRVKRSRGDAAAKALSGPLLAALAFTTILVVFSAVLAVVGQSELAVISGGMAVLAVAAAVVVVAVRLERRT